MAEFRKSTFNGGTIALDGNKFIKCRFINCRITYEGGIPPSLENCTFTGETFEFLGPAANTLALLRAFSLPGSGFEPLVRGSFPELIGKA